MNTEIITETTESKMQFILDENGELQEIAKDKCKVVEYPIKYKLKNAFEVFVRVEGTENYWISNYGRCVNNLNRKDKNTFYKHKEGKCHYTIFEIERYEVRNKKGKPTGEIAENRYKRETTPEDLVVDAFIVKYKGRFKVWHKDGDESNNWYKNLLTVTPDDSIRPQISFPISCYKIPNSHKPLFYAACESFVMYADFTYLFISIHKILF